MRHGAYSWHGVCLRNHCRAEPSRDPEPARVVSAVGGGDRARAAHAAAGRVQAPASAARGGVRRIHGGCTAPSLPAETGAPSGGRRLAGPVPPALVRPRRCSRPPPGPDGLIHTIETKDEEKEMTDREPYTPGPASGARVEKEGEKWTLVLVRELHHPPQKVWEALTDPAHLREWAP